MLWPDADPDTSRGRLRRLLHRLQKVVGKDLLSPTSETLGLHPETTLWVDVLAFQQALATCLARDRPAGPLNPTCIAQLSDAVALYTDDFLAGFTLPDSPTFDEWQTYQTEWLYQKLLQALDQLVAACQAQGMDTQALAHAVRRVALDPLHESAHRQLMQLYAANGQFSAALHQYETCVRILREELNIAPAPKTTALYDQIRQHEPSDEW